MKAWPIDPLGLRSIQLEVSEKLPQDNSLLNGNWLAQEPAPSQSEKSTGISLACGSQAFIATLLFDLSVSVGSTTRNWSEQSLRPSARQGLRCLFDSRCFLVCCVSLRFAKPRNLDMTTLTVLKSVLTLLFGRTRDFEPLIV